MPDLPPRLSAALADRYRLERELGAGGMATVYLAEDLRHQRRVAIKVLKPELAAVLGADRFIQEITTTAQLQHPHILPLFDSGSADGFLFYVMPYVEGETLRDKLDRETQLGVEEAVRIAREVADALDYAHRRGVIHRDIKPENILLHDGRPVVADFGIALAVSAAAGGRMTETGTSLGTPHYMSPEQATADRVITGRSDVYSLGVVLYEMLSGDPPHVGASAQQIIVKIIADEARPVGEVRKSVPPNVAAAVAKALEKLPADRFETAKAFADALADPAFRGTGPLAAGILSRGAARTSLRSPVVWVLALVAVTASLFAAYAWSARRAAAPDGAVRFAVDLPAGLRPALAEMHGQDLAISPDGATLVFPVLDPQGARRLFARRLDEADARVLPGTEGGFAPAFTAEGDALLFWAAGRLQRLAIGGDAPQVVGEYGVLQSATGVDGGDVVFSVAPTPYLMRVSAEGGAARPAAALDTVNGETSQYDPVALDDGRHVLYTSWGRGSAEDARIGLLDLSTGRARRLDVPGTLALGVLDGRLIYTDQAGTVLAAPFDPGSGGLESEPVPVAGGVATRDRGAAVAALSPTGTLAYVPGNRGATLVLANEDGSVPFLSEVRPYSFPRYSPDGTRVALTIASGTSSDVWIQDVTSGTLTRLTSGGTVNERAEWSPDGSRVLFRTDRGGRSALWWQAADGFGTASPLLADDGADYFEGVLTPDGHHLVYQVDTGGANVMIRGTEGDDAPRAIADSEANEDEPRISPDGRCVAWVTEESGGPQVVMQPLSGEGPRVPVSLRRGSEPMWSPDGRRLFYRTERRFRVAEVSTTPACQVVSRADFMDDTFLRAPEPHANYDVSPDGTQLLVLEGQPQRLLVVHGWGVEVGAALRQAGGR